MFHPARITLAALLALPVLVFAQPDDAVVPAATCVKPAVPAIGTKLDAKSAEKLNGESKAYAACASAYIAERRAIAAKHQAIVTTQTNAGNAFATEFNAYAAALDAFSKAQAAADAKAKK